MRYINLLFTYLLTYWEGKGRYVSFGWLINAGCAGKTEIPRERVPYLSALEVCSRRGAI